MNNSPAVQHELNVNTPHSTVDDNTAQPPHSSDVEGPQGSRKLQGIRWALLVVAVVSPFFLFALDNTIVADVQPRILKTLGGIEKLPWISVAFALGAVSVNLLGKFYGQLETKTTFLISILIFEVGSVVCGAAPSMDVLIVGRTICGLGGSGIYLGCMNVLSNLTTEAERPAYLSLVGLMWGLGTVLGPIIGGAFADSSATWRWSFFINLCVGGAATPAYIFLLPVQDPRPGVAVTTRFREIDIVGTILIAGASVSSIMAISFGGSVYAWDSAQIVSLFVCTGVLWAVFCIQQLLCVLTTKTRRIFPMEMGKSYEMVLFFVLTICSITSCFVPIYFIPLYFQFAIGDSALRAAVRLLPFVVVLVSAVIFNGIVMGKVGYYKPFFVIGSILVLTGASLMYTLNLYSGTGRLYGYSVILALGTGLFSQAAFPVAQAVVQPSEVSAATAFIGCAQIGGLAFALAVSNTLFINLAISAISAILPNVDVRVVRQAISGASADFLPGVSAEKKEAVLKAIVSSISKVYIMAIAVGALAVISSVFLRWKKLFPGTEGVHSPRSEGEWPVVSSNFTYGLYKRFESREIIMSTNEHSGNATLTQFPADSLRNPQRLITGHNKDGNTIFLATDHGDHHGLMLDGIAAQNCIYSTATVPVDLNDNKDVTWAEQNK
ncbi:MAG: hypothetical protein Q9214_005635, partial [Letrouitia sp. 1 TL-2023]